MNSGGQGQGQAPIFILKEGTSQTRGKTAQSNNIAAAKAVANSVRSTLGPKGMDKMLVDSMGDVVITNDGATILKEMDIEHPAAKMIVEISKTVDNEVGDGTTMGSRCTISANANIGKNTTIKYAFVLTDTPNLEEGDMKSVRGIGDNVLVGANVTLMPGFSGNTFAPASTEPPTPCRRGFCRSTREDWAALRFTCPGGGGMTCSSEPEEHGALNQSHNLFHCS